jgi:UDPglucose 6-dehydrogenase
MRIGIVGGGFVGGATSLLECDDIQVIVYDIDPSRCKPEGTTITDLKTCDLVFVCVPTPTKEDGSCNLTIVERCVESLQDHGISNIVLRSTVPPGTSERLNVMFMPEFLTEANWATDFFQCSCWIFGTRSDTEAQLFQTMLDNAKQAGRIQNATAMYVTCKEAEMIKYARNNFLALKISFANEMYRICEKMGIEYAHVRDGLSADKRIGASHLSVPGHDGHYGYGGTCLPKDTSALVAFATSMGVPTPVLSAVVHRNRDLDRPERDWEQDPRAFTKSK